MVYCPGEADFMGLFGPSIALTGKDSILTPLAQLIVDENIPALEVEKKNGWKINQPFEICEHLTERAFTLAASEKKTNVIAWLLRHKAKLNIIGWHAIEDAVGACSTKTLQLLIDHGADVNAPDIVSRVLYANRPALLPFLMERGLDVKKHGASLRQAVSERQFRSVKMLLNLGFDVNFHEPDGVHDNNPTAVHVAAQNKNDFKTVKLLVEHGADITLLDKNGDRPFSAAMQNNDAPLMAYLKAREPAEWHSETQHLASLASYKLPQSMLDICSELQKRKRKICFKHKSERRHGVAHIVLHPTLLLKASTYGKRAIVEFVGKTDNYDTFMVWYPAKICLAYIDRDHGNFRAIGTWEALHANPDAFYEKYLSKYF
jgi:uncharacterized protein